MALLDILTDDSSRTGGSEGSSQEGKLLRSVELHLARLLNARQGSLMHLTDYGLPDIPEIYRGLPYSVGDLLRSIKEAIERYEPRLTSVMVKRMESVEEDCVLRLEITGTLITGEITKFDTYFLSGGSAKVVTDAE